MSALARDVEDRLSVVDQGDDRQGPQGRSVEVEGEAPGRQAGDAKDEVAKSQDDAGDGEVADVPDIGPRRDADIVGRR